MRTSLRPRSAIKKPLDSAMRLGGRSVGTQTRSHDTNRRMPATLLLEFALSHHLADANEALFFDSIRDAESVVVGQRTPQQYDS